MPSIFVIILLLVSTLLYSFPQGIAFAETEYIEDTDDNGTIRNETSGREYDRAHIDKKVSRTGDNPGEYFIDLTIEGKSESDLETTDIVLVYDNSNSMSNNNRVEIAHTATTNFVNSLLNGSGNFQMGLITYGTVVMDGRVNAPYPREGSTENLSYKGLTENAINITELLPSNIPSDRGRSNDGGTFTQQGLEEAGYILGTSTADNKVIVTITDGAPTVSYHEDRSIVGNGTSFFYNNNRSNHGVNTISEANSLKELYELYTIAIELGGGDAGASPDQVKEVIYGISTSDEYAYFANNINEVEGILNDIARNLSGSIIDGSVTDPMGEMFILKGLDDFNPATTDELTDGDYFLSANDSSLLEGVVVRTDGDTISLYGLNLNEGEIVTLRYKVQLDTDHEDFQPDTLYRTNGETTLTPRGSHTEEVNVFPEPWASATGIIVSGEKTWQDNGQDHLRPESIDILLMRDIGGNTVEVDQATVTPDADGNWTYEFTNQIAFDSDGNAIDYYVKEVSVPGYETVYGDNQLDVTNILISDPAISLEKNANRDDLVAGEQIKYTFTVVNTGNVALADVTIEDVLEGISEITYVTVNDEIITDVDSITLQPGDVLVAEAAYTITQADVDSGQVENIATVTGYDPNEDPVTDEDEEMVYHEPNPSISLVKTSDVDEVSEVGQIITYTFNVKNTGDVTLREIVLDDPMLGGEVVLTTTTLAPGESTTVHVEYKVTQADLDNGVVENVAFVEGTPPNHDPDDPKPGDEDDVEVPMNQDPAISLVKEADRNDLVAGEEINYTFTAKNIGNVTLTDVTLDDVLEGISAIEYVSVNGEAIDDVSSITLKPGDVLIAHASYTITQADVDKGVVENIATVTGFDPNDEPVTDEDEVLVPQESDPRLSLVKTSDVEEITEVGQIVTYNFDITNIGNVTIKGIQLDDPMLGGVIELESTTLAPGESTTVSIEYEVTEADLVQEELVNVAIVTGESPNPDDPQPKDEDMDHIPVARINLEKTSDVEEITKVGQKITYSFRVENTGKVTLSNIELDDPMLGGAIELEQLTLEPGEVTTGTAVYEVTQADLDNAGITNIATVTGNTPEEKLVHYEDDDVISKGKVGDKLPKTATNLFNMLAIGVGLLILGMTLIVYRRKREMN